MAAAPVKREPPQMSRLERFFVGVWDDLRRVKQEGPEVTEVLWYLLAIVFLILGKLPPKEVSEWFGEAFLQVRPWSTYGFITIIAWRLGMRWERSRLPGLTIGTPRWNAHANTFELLIGSTENDELETHAYVTEVFNLSNGRWVKDFRVRGEVELNWSGLPSGKTTAYVSRVIPQWSGFLIFGFSDRFEGSRTKPNIYVDGKGGPLPLYDSLFLKDQHPIKVKVVAKLIDARMQQATETGETSIESPSDATGNPPLLAYSSRHFVIIPNKKTTTFDQAYRAFPTNWFKECLWKRLW